MRVIIQQGDDDTDIIEYNAQVIHLVEVEPNKVKVWIDTEEPITVDPSTITIKEKHYGNTITNNYNIG